jgi:ankyrin repeat protein
MTFCQFATGFDPKFEIDNGYDLDGDGRTALHLAVVNNDIVMVNNLLKDGANPNFIDSFGCTPLEISLKENLTSIAK